MKNLPEGHPLKDKEIDYLRSWPEWREYWSKTKEVEVLIGLLHYGLDTRYSGGVEQAERIDFYLKTAYGYRSMPDDPDDRLGGWATALGVDVKSRVRQKVAEKAWKMLCVKVFAPLVAKDIHDSVTARAWLRLLQRQENVKELVEFFSEEENLPEIDRGSEPDHATLAASKFLERFVTIGWNYRQFILAAGSGFDCDRSSQKFLNFRPQLLQIIGTLRWWDKIFLNQEWMTKNLWRNLSAEDLRVVQEIVIKSWNEEGSLRSEDKEAPFDLTTAALESPSARFLLLVRELLEEKSRQEQITEAERQKREADEKLARVKKTVRPG